MPSSGPAEIPTLSLHDALPIFTLGYEGMAVPGIPGRTFTSLREVNTNATGGVTFEGRFTGGDGNAAWAGSPASPTLLARWGSPAPIPGTVYGQHFSSPNLGSGGQTVMHVQLENASTRAMAGTAIVAGPIGALQSVARTGQAAPGTSANYAAPSIYPMISSNNALTFSASLAGAGVVSDNDTGLWAGTKDAVNLIAREGSAAPGLGGATFGDFL